MEIFGDISFLVDTGADATVLMPMDGIRLGLDYNSLTGGKPAVGVGGLSVMFQESAHVMFLEGTSMLHLYSIELGIASTTPDISDVPSLLGRNIIDRWAMTYNPAAGELSFSVNSSDHTLDVTSA